MNIEDITEGQMVEMGRYGSLDFHMGRVVQVMAAGAIIRWGNGCTLYTSGKALLEIRPLSTAASTAAVVD